MALEADLSSSLSERPKLPIESILVHTEFQKAVRLESEPLLKRLRQKKSIRQMSKWVFEETQIPDPNFTRISRIVVDLFTSPVQKVFAMFAESEALADAMFDFLTSKASFNPLLCGFFARILTQQVRWGNCRLFEMHEETGPLLITRIGSLAIQDLLLVIATNSWETLRNANFLEKLSEYAIYDDQLADSAIATIVHLYDSIVDEGEVFSGFIDRNFVSNLITFCFTSKSALLVNDVMEIITHVIEVQPNFLDLIKQHRQKFLLQPGNINIMSVATIPLLVPDYLEVFALFFEPDSFKELHQYCTQVLPMLDPHDVIEIALIPQFIEKLVACWETENWCCHMTQIAVAFARILPKLETFNNDTWDRFMQGSFSELLEVLDSPFGGDFPDPCDVTRSNTGDSSEEDYEYDDEEEDL